MTAPDVRLARPAARLVPISIVPMIDVLLILLIFFMVTSTYIDLDALPVVEGEAGPADQTAAASDGLARLSVRIAADGSLRVQGQSVDGAALEALLRERLAEGPLEVLVFPSPRAEVQALATLLDIAAAAQLQRLRILEIAP